MTNNDKSVTVIACNNQHGHHYVQFARSQHDILDLIPHRHEKVQVGNDQEKAQSEKDSHSKTEVGKNQTNNQALIP